MTRASDKEVDEKEFKSQWENSTSKDMGLGKTSNPFGPQAQYANRKRGGGNAAVMRSLERNTDTESDKQDLGSQFAASQPGMRAQNRLGLATKQTAIDKNTTSNRIDTSTAGRRLDEKVLMGDMRNNINKENTVSRVGETQEGKDLKHALGTTKIVTQGQDYVAATELLKDDSILNVRMNTAAEKLTNEAVTAAETQLITEATTEASSPVLDSIDSTVRSNLQYAQLNKKVATAATESAERVQKQEWEAAVLDDQSPVSREAAGIDNVNNRGETRVKAVASESIRKNDELDVAARAIMIGRNVAPNDLIRVAGEALDTSRVDNDEIGAQAAIKHLLETGSPGKVRLGQELKKIPLNDHTDSTNAAKATVLAKNIKPSDVTISTWATDKTLRDLQTIRLDPKTYEGLSTEELSTQIGDNLIRGIITGGITKEAADNLLANQQALKNLSPVNKKMIEDYAADHLAEQAKQAAKGWPD